MEIQTPQNEKNKDTLGVVAARALIELAGEDVNREGLSRTPLRFQKAYSHLTQGYQQTLVEVVGAGLFRSESDAPIAVNGIEFYSLCEHHILPFWGSVNVVYIPNHKILGLSKIPRIVEMYARRFQVQERLTKEIGQGIIEVIDPKFVAVKMTASHMCMKMRGVQKQNSFASSEFMVGEDKISETILRRSLNLLDAD